MSAKNPALSTVKPVSILDKPIEVDYKELFKALATGIGHAAFGKWEEMGADTADLLASLGLSTEPGELAFLLVKRSIIKTVFSIVGESAGLLQFTEDEENTQLLKKLDEIISHEKIYLDSTFLDRPSDLPILKHLQAVLQIWLEGYGISQPGAVAIVNRIPSYFIYALNEEWRRNAKVYTPLIEALNTPFTKAGERDWAWTTYAALLQREIQKSVFDEAFSLSQIYIPLNAYYVEENEKKDVHEIARPDKERQRVVVPLQDELGNWLANPNSSDAIRVISGGPGSGKSSFARIFAARVANQHGKLKVLFVPLHLLDAAQDLVDEVGRFVQDEGILKQNPLHPDSAEPNLLIIFDGLDELASQGKAAAETARAFIREVERTVEKRNIRSVKLRILISGRELVIQENESEFRKPRQVLNLLPYFIPEDERKQYQDPSNLLNDDLRQQWWQHYGTLTGNGYAGLPTELNRDDLHEITAQPLLNYLVALSFIRSQSTHGALDFSKDIDLNSIYADLVAAIYERGYEKRRPFAPIRHMALKEFERVLEEIGLAAWHGDGRSTTVREIEEHCQASGVGGLLDTFKDGAEKGVTRLLAAFFFRRYGQRISGDPTFVFTHKSFGEYLAARRIVRAMERVGRELERRANSLDEGWDEKEALWRWAQICGPSSISQYLHVFLLSEIKSYPLEQAMSWQKRFTKLFSYMLKHNIPVEQLQVKTFKEMLQQSRNAEEALLIALNACARKTRQISIIEHPSPMAFGTWFKRILGQRPGESLAENCLSFLELSRTVIHIGDFYQADLNFSILKQVQAIFCSFNNDYLVDTDLTEAILLGANFENADLTRANLIESNLRVANLRNANLTGVNLTNADLIDANLRNANLTGVNLTNADLTDANLRNANLTGADLVNADLRGADITNTNFTDAKLTGTQFIEADLRNANFTNANLTEAIVE